MWRSLVVDIASHLFSAAFAIHGTDAGCMESRLTYFQQRSPYTAQMPDACNRVSLIFSSVRHTRRGCRMHAIASHLFSAAFAIHGADAGCMQSRLTYFQQRSPYTAQMPDAWNRVSLIFSSVRHTRRGCRVHGDGDAGSEFHGLHQQLLGRYIVGDREWYDYKRQPNGFHKENMLVSIIHIVVCNSVSCAHFTRI